MKMDESFCEYASIYERNLCEYASQNGHLEVLKYLHENECPSII